MINIFINIKSRELFIKYFIIIFSFLELITIIWFIKEGTAFNIWRLTEFREVIYIWPNHFAMMSAIKFGFVITFRKTKNNHMSSNILMLFSLITIAFSLSRTGMIMLITIIVLPILLRYKSNKHKVKFYK